MCAIHGHGLCESGLRAGQLIFRNILRFVAVDCVVGIVFGLSRILLAAGTGVLAYLLLCETEMTENDQCAIIILLTVGAFFIAGTFLNVYSMAVDTMILCFRK